ncbi:MAG TPA: DUF106 domain-containing protein [Thermoplasmatales archaeon]|nr:DUF106 domain-containing protein [Thermoplasmatales archaeon]
MMDVKPTSPNPMTYMLLFFCLILVVMPYLGPILGVIFGYALDPLIGFNGRFPILTIALAGVFVVVLSSFFNTLFMDWKAMGRAQEISKAFQRELSQARKNNDTQKIKKLMKMQPKILQMTTQSSSGTMKMMIPLVIFIFPIFIWLRVFLSGSPYLFFTVPWAERVALYGRTVMQHWLLLYLVFSIVFGQVFRQAFKAVSLSNWWQNIKAKKKSVH